MLETAACLIVRSQDFDGSVVESSGIDLLALAQFVAAEKHAVRHVHVRQGNRARVPVQVAGTRLVELGFVQPDLECLR